MGDRTEAQRQIADAYYEGLGDGLVAATAIMGNASNEIVAEIKAEIAAKRREYAGRLALAEEKGG